MNGRADLNFTGRAVILFSSKWQVMETKTMGRPRTNYRKYELQHLTPRHMAVLRLAVKGHSYKAISAATGMSKKAISYTMNASIAQPVLERLNAAQDQEAVSAIHLMRIIQDAEALRAMR